MSRWAVKQGRPVQSLWDVLTGQKGVCMACGSQGLFCQSEKSYSPEGHSWIVPLTHHSQIPTLWGWGTGWSRQVRGGWVCGSITDRDHWVGACPVSWLQRSLCQAAYILKGWKLHTFGPECQLSLAVIWCRYTSGKLDEGCMESLALLCCLSNLQISHSKIF